MAKQSNGPPPDDDPEDDPDFTPAPPVSNLPVKRTAALTRPASTAVAVAERPGQPVETRTPNERALEHGASTLELTPKEAAILAAPVDPEDVLIRPDGIVYLAHMKLRQVLNRAIGVGQWAMIPQSEPKLIAERNCIAFMSAFFVRGHLQDVAMGEQKYFPSSGGMSFADALEGAKSNALTRHSKAIGVGLELWDKRWRAAWKDKHAVKVRVRKSGGAIEQAWRRKDEDPLEHEIQDAAPAGGRVANPAPAEPQAAPASRRPAASSKPAPKPAPVEVVDPDPDAEDPEVYEADYATKKGNMKLWKHREWDAKRCLSDGKIARIQIAAFVGARRQGIEEDAIGEHVRQVLSRVAGAQGYEHFSLCPWQSAAYDRLYAEVEAAFGGGD